MSTHILLKLHLLINTNDKSYKKSRNELLLFNYVMCAKICCPTLSQNRTILTSMSNLCLKTLQFHAHGIMLVNKKTENVNFKYFRNQIQQIDFGCNFMRENTFYASNSCTL